MSETSPGVTQITPKVAVWSGFAKAIGGEPPDGDSMLFMAPRYGCYTEVTVYLEEPNDKLTVVGTIFHPDPCVFRPYTTARQLADIPWIRAILEEQFGYYKS